MAGAPRVYKVEGVILRRRNLGEADTIFTIFTAEQGKFDAVARGVRKARSRMRGHLEPLTRSRLMLARGRTLDVFTQAETIAAYRNVRDDLERQAAAFYCAELVDRFTAERQEQRDVFGLLVLILEALDLGAPLQVVRLFELRLLTLTGFELQVDSCVICGGRLPETETLLSGTTGGAVCANCRATAGGGRLLSVRALKVIRFAQSASLDAFAGLRMSDDLAGEVRLALADVIRAVLDREPSTTKFVSDVARVSRALHPA